MLTSEHTAREIEQKARKVIGINGTDRVEKQNEFLADVGIDTDFSNNVSNKIRNKCRELGQNGWVISPFWEPNNEETWYDTWYKLLQMGKKKR